MELSASNPRFSDDNDSPRGSIALDHRGSDVDSSTRAPSQRHGVSFTVDIDNPFGTGNPLAASSTLPRTSSTLQRGNQLSLGGSSSFRGTNMSGVFSAISSEKNASVLHSDEDFKKEIVAQQRARSLKFKKYGAIFAAGILVVSLIAVSSSIASATSNPTIEPTLAPVPGPPSTLPPVVDLGSGEPLESFLPKAMDAALNNIYTIGMPTGPNILTGSVRAAPGECPDYRACWARDQALTYGALLDYYEEELPSQVQLELEGKFKAYVAYVKEIFQRNTGKSAPDGRVWIHSETKYELNGDMFQGSWSNQNDGPALRAVALMRFAVRYLQLNPSASAYVNNEIKPLVQQDMNFLAENDNWNAFNNDPWEEIYGGHFYSRTAIRRAFLMSKTAFGSPIVSNVDNIVNTIEATIATEHFVTSDDYGLKVVAPSVWERLDVEESKKLRQGDVQTVLASIHANPRSERGSDNYLFPGDDRMLTDALHTLLTFQEMYPINRLNWKEKPYLGPAIGRFKFDRYNGGDKFKGTCLPPIDICPLPCEGQPWFISTLGIAEHLYRALEVFLLRGSITINSDNRMFYDYIGSASVPSGSWDSTSPNFRRSVLRMWYLAESVMKRAQEHTDGRFSLSEQFSGHTGLMMSAGDLTWSYGAMLTATLTRKHAKRELLNRFPKLFVPQNPDVEEFLEVEIVVTKVPIRIENTATTERMVLVGNQLGTGYDDACSATRAYLRRSVQGYNEYSVMVPFLRNFTTEFQLVHVEDNAGAAGGCTIQEQQPGGRITTFIPSATPDLPFYSVWCEDCTSPPTPPLFPDVKVVFKIVFGKFLNIESNYNLRVLGDDPGLGSWDPCAEVSNIAIKTKEVGDDQIWTTGPVYLPAEIDIAFKIAKVPKENCRKEDVVWTAGEDSIFRTPKADFSNPNIITTVEATFAP